MKLKKVNIISQINVLFFSDHYQLSELKKCLGLSSFPKDSLDFFIKLTHKLVDEMKTGTELALFVDQ